MTDGRMFDGLGLLTGQHVKFMSRMLFIVPERFSSFDTQRMTVAFFAISGLDLLGSLNVLTDKRKEYVEWLYRTLISPSAENSDDEEVLSKSGFRGSTAMKVSPGTLPTHPYDFSHIAMTYTGLASLVILGDDLSRLSRRAIARGVRALQLPDGSYKATLEGGENDMRFLYCAAAICYILDDWDGMDKDLAFNYITRSINYDGGIGQGPWLESHGGSTFCAVAALSLMGKLSELGEAKLSELKRWCILRQNTGFQGRPHKPEDTCYSFWVGATLKLLGIDHLTDKMQNRHFVLGTQDAVTGGLAKWEDVSPDPLHTYLGLGGLSIIETDNLAPIDPALNISQRAVTHLKELHRAWSNS